MVPWDGVNSLEHNANNQINPSWHAQAVVKGNYYSQTFDGSSFSNYSTVLISQAGFDIYKHTGTQWWIVCSTLPPFSEKTNFNGEVGIGTKNPNGWKLAVNGKIRAKEIKVETGWSDFVFENDYNLPSLKEVEKHIKEKGHLKDIPSAKEVEKNGIFLGEMDSKLLQKIEELTLYAIQQDKEIKELKLLVEKLLKQKK